MLKNCHVFRFIDDLMQRVTVGNLKIITNNAKLQVKGLVLKIFDSHPYRERNDTLISVKEMPRKSINRPTLNFFNRAEITQNKNRL